MPRDYRKSMPRKKKRVALRRVLADFIRDSQITVVDDLKMDSHKTKELATLLAGLGTPKKTLLVDDNIDSNLLLASRNIPGVGLRRTQDVNAYDLLFHEHVTISKSAMETLKEAVAS